MRKRQRKKRKERERRESISEWVRKREREVGRKERERKRKIYSFQSWHQNLDSFITWWLLAYIFYFFSFESNLLSLFFCLFKTLKNNYSRDWEVNCIHRRCINRHTHIFRRQGGLIKLKVFIRLICSNGLKILHICLLLERGNFSSVSGLSLTQWIHYLHIYFGIEN